MLCRVVPVTNTFIWSIWWSSYLPPQLGEVVADQFYFYLVFNCLDTQQWIRLVASCPLLLYFVASRKQQQIIYGKTRNIFSFLLFHTICFYFVGGNKVGLLLKMPRKQQLVYPTEHKSKMEPPRFNKGTVYLIKPRQDGKTGRFNTLAQLLNANDVA